MIKELLKMDKSVWKYICNTCFNYQSECKCTGQHNFLGMDEHIIESIQILHSKRYQTVGCCEGHVSVSLGHKGGIHTSYFPLYISLDHHSLEDFKREFENNPEWEENGFALIPSKELGGNNRYQLVYNKKIRAKGDKYDDFMAKKMDILKKLNILLNSLQVRAWGEDEKLIQTNY